MSQPTHDHGHPHAPASNQEAQQPAQRRSVLAWPAWLRVLAVLPVLLALWLAVWWTHTGVGVTAW